MSSKLFADLNNPVLKELIIAPNDHQLEIYMKKKHTIIRRSKGADPFTIVEVFKRTR